VTAVLVPDVPHGHGRMAGVAPGHPAREVGGGRAEGGGAGAVVLPGAGREPPAVRRDRQDLGVRGDEPGRRRRGAGGQVDADARLGQQVEDPVQPARRQLAWRGLQPGPGENPDRDQVDARLGHEADVLGPGRLRPLLRVVVPSVPDASHSLTLQPAHSVMLPAARPDRQQRCNDKKAITSGITEMSEPMIMFQIATN